MVFISRFTANYQYQKYSMKMIEKIQLVYHRLFSENNIKIIEKYAVYLALAGFFVHLILIFLWNINLIDHAAFIGFNGNYISAIYTPFSFLLIFEVFLLLVFIPKSFTRSIGKQFEIILLIVLRRIFKDISHFDSQHLIENLSKNSELLLDMMSVLVLFLLIAVFYRLKKREPSYESCGNIKSFIAIKQLIAMLMIPVMGFLIIISFGGWFRELITFHHVQSLPMADINNVFYDVFFTILIFVDVLILIISFLYTRYFSQLVRNSGFVISTILIRLSFAAPHQTNLFLIGSSVIFGVLILLIYNYFIKVEGNRTGIDLEPVNQTSI